MVPPTNPIATAVAASQRSPLNRSDILNRSRDVPWRAAADVRYQAKAFLVLDSLISATILLRLDLWLLNSLPAVFVLAVLHQVIDHRGISQRRSISKIAEFIFRNLAQDSAHDLAG